MIHRTTSKPEPELPLTDNHPNFGKFDSETDEEKQKAYLEFLVRQRWREVIDKFRKPFVIGIKICILALLLLWVVYGISCIPKKIHQEYAGVKYRLSSSEKLEKIHIRIEGKLYRQLFHKPLFKGYVMLPGPEDFRKYKARIEFLNGINNTGLLSYVNDENAFDFNIYGYMKTDKNFSSVVLNVFEPEVSNGKEEKDLVIIAPVNNKQEAEEIIVKSGMRDKYPFNGYSLKKEYSNK